MSDPSSLVLVLGIDPGLPRDKATAACSILTLDPAGTIGLPGRSRAMRKPELAAFLRDDPLLADQRLRVAAIGAPLTPVRIERKPWRARQVEIRLSRGAFAGSVRGPQPPWISAGRPGWLRYQEGAAVLNILRERGLPLLAMPPEEAVPELPGRCAVEVYPKATLAVLLPRDPLKERPMANEFMGEIDDWLFPQIFLRQPMAGGAFPTSDPERAPIEDILEVLAPDLRLAPETLEEAARITAIRRPFSRREPLRAFIAAFQGILALREAACLVGAPGDSEGSLLLPATWHRDWEAEWNHPRAVPLVRRVPVTTVDCKATFSPTTLASTLRKDGYD